MTDSLPIPSEGLFYNKDKYGNTMEYLEVEYLTTEDEMVLCTPNLFNRGEALYRVLERKIEPFNDIKIDELLINDRDMILLWLREMAFGNLIDYIDKEGKRFVFDTQNIGIRKFDLKPSYDLIYKKKIGDYDFEFTLLRVLDERKYKTKFNKLNFYSASIHSVNGEVLDFVDKKEFLSNTSIKLGREIKRFIDNINFGVDKKTIYNYDGKVFKTEITMDEVFFGVSKENLSKNSTALNESIFFLLNEGQGYTNSDIMKMSTHVRLFNIEKLSQKIKKHNDEINKNNKSR